MSEGKRTGLLGKSAAVLLTAVILTQAMPVSASAAVSEITATLSADTIYVVPGQKITLTETLNGTNNLTLIDGSDVNTFTTVIGYDSSAFAPAEGPTTLPENTIQSDVDYNKNYDAGHVYYSCYSNNESGSSRRLNDESGGADNIIDMVSWEFTADVNAVPGTYRFYLTPTYNSAANPLDCRTYLNTFKIGEFQTMSSNYIDVTILDVPDIPVNLTATAGDKAVTLTWNEVSGATSYKVYYGTEPGVLTTSQEVDENSASITGLVNGTTYYFAVSSSNVTGSSMKSAEVSAIPVSSDATLSSLTVSVGSFSPAFASDVTNYTISVAKNVSSITFIPTASDGSAVIKVNGIEVASGSQSQEISLSEGGNSVDITVKAGDDVTEVTYKITVTREISLPAFSIKGSATSPNLRFMEFISSGTTYQLIRGLNPLGESVSQVMSYFELADGTWKLYKWSSTNETYTEVQDTDNVTVVGNRFKIDIYSNSGTLFSTYYIVILGDLNASGTLNNTDTAALRSHVSNTIKINDALMLYAADLNSSGTVNNTDTAALRSHISNKNRITQ